MSKKNDTITLLASLLITAGILGTGVWFLLNKVNLNPTQTPNPTASSTIPSNNPSPPASTLPPPPSPGIPAAFAPPTTVAAGTLVRVDGSTSMVGLNQALKKSFEQQFPGTKVETNAQGSDKGILALLTGKLDVAAVSRPLAPEEAGQGLRAIPVATDKIAIAIGQKNPFRGSLSPQQVADIFTGKITNWSAVGGQPATIRVINRPAVSGTHQVFQQLILKGAAFGSSANFTTVERDATTPILQALGADGISYATSEQLINQKTVRIIPIDGQTPESPSYPFQRSLYYVYKDPASPAVQAFMGFVASPQGKQAIAQANR